MLKRGKAAQALPFPLLAAFPFRIEGGSARLSTEGGLTLTITLSHPGFSIRKASLSGSEGAKGWSACWELRGKKETVGRLEAGKKRKCLQCILNLELVLLGYLAEGGAW